MLFTWDTQNLCIIFRQWRITGLVSLLFSLLAVAALTAGYELVRQLSRRYERRCAAATATTQNSKGLPKRDDDDDNNENTTTTMQEPGKLVKAAFYAVQVFYSFFIMLLFMTYNGWIMLSVAAGAFVGYLVWGGGSGADKSVACH
ncbi:MAG: hypothetical protein M1816_002105 [Peltula sp. TS41687]|nr:MAG: hypothetical protein M1816_002105 [Peltula sp. TS41687]